MNKEKKQGSLRKIILGFDLGKVSAAAARAELGPGAALNNLKTWREPHQGRPLEFFAKIYREHDPRSILGIAVAGVYGKRFSPPVLAGIPDETVQEWAARALLPEGPFNLFRLGARGYSILTRDENGLYQYDENDKCSAGTGETIEKICSRLGYSLEEAVELASRAERGIPVSSRCSVFAKTEITHYANQGEDHGEILLGYFQSIAKNLAALFAKRKVNGPVYLAGGGARLKPVVEAFSRLIGSPVKALEQADVLEALGALYFAASRHWPEAEWPEDPARLLIEEEKRIKPVVISSRPRVRFLEAEPAEVPNHAPAVAGLDLGSTGSKLALISADTGEVILDLYRRTDGNPVEAAKKLIRELLEKNGNPVVAVGLTGSGREAAALVFRAAFPESEERLVVENEIVAHATAAAALDPDRGESLSIVEIGGQDAKFINIQGGRIVESDMNRACSAGTGSFLEEQAIFYGEPDISRFGEIAARSENPPDLGQMCTVFVAEAAAQALNEGYTIPDIFKGFQFSVLYNYLNRVMGNRQFMKRIFFQGKPASNRSLAETLAMITGREVIVPPNPGAMGAIGIAMLARKQLASLPLQDGALALQKIVDSEVMEKREFQCRDPECGNLCRIEKAKILVAGEEVSVLSGGSCPKYEEAKSRGRKLDRDAPAAFRERRELLLKSLKRDCSQKGPVVSIPLGHYLHETLPFFHALFSEMGFQVKLALADQQTLERGNRRCAAYDSCTPAKFTHGLADGDADIVFLPKLVHLPPAAEGAGTSTCAMTQAVPEMVEKALVEEGAKARVVRPVLDLSRGWNRPRVKAELLKTFAALAREGFLSSTNLARFSRAFKSALAAQEEFERGLEAIGRRTLEYARERNLPVALVCGTTHLIHETLLNAGIPELIAQSGALALPVDCFPVPANAPSFSKVYWSAGNRIMRACYAAAGAGDIFPLLLVNHACVQMSFLEHTVHDLLEGYPHALMESDGHGGRAGFLTRVQAFLHSARNYAGSPKPPSLDRKAARYQERPRPPVQELKRGRVLVTGGAPFEGEHKVAVMKTTGWDVDFIAPYDRESFREASRFCSGKECLYYIAHLAKFRHYLREKGIENQGKPVFLYNVTGCGPCRNGMFPLGDEIALEKMGLSPKVQIVTPGSFQEDRESSGRKWLSLVGMDILNQLRLFYRPEEENPGESDRLFYKYGERLREVLGTHPQGRGAGEIARRVKQTEAVIEEAALAFRDMPKKGDPAGELRTALLCGEVSVRTDEWQNEKIAEKLNRLGLRVILEPFSELGEALVYARSPELIELDLGRLSSFLILSALEYTKNRLFSKAAFYHPWLKWDQIKAVYETGRTLLDTPPFAESILTLGSALLAWENRRVDGVVVVGPWCCSPTLIAEAQLRRRKDIPSLFLYFDGSPLDDSRLRGFAWRLKSRPPRTRLF